MLVVGLTGGVGMGKSTVASWLRARGESVVDTDEIARDVVAPETEALEEIRVRFGNAMVRRDGSLNRAALAEVVFANVEDRKTLEEMLHPRIRARWKGVVETWRGEGKRRAIVVIPLLFEIGAQNEFGRTVCVACTPGVQLARLQERGWSAEESARRVAAQWPIAHKMDLCDGVIWNESTVEVCEMQAARLFD